MKNRATYIMIITIAMIMTAISVGGCFTSCNSEPTYELVPTTTITTEATTTTTTQETTVETTAETTETTTETIENSTIESTVESNYKNNDIDFGNDKGAAETHKNHNGGTVKPTKAPDKKPASTKKPEPTKKPDPTKAPEATKAPTNTPKPTEKPKPTATPVPSKGTAIIKVKVTTHVYIDDESDETEAKTDYFEIEATTKNYHSKKLSDYHYDSKVIGKKLTNKYGDNISNFSAKTVEIVKFTN